MFPSPLKVNQSETVTIIIFIILMETCCFVFVLFDNIFKRL